MKRINWQLNRRHFLWAGLGAAAAGSLRRQQVTNRRKAELQAALEAQARAQFDPKRLTQEAYEADLQAVAELLAVRDRARLQAPSVPYSRPQSQHLILANKLATQQYLTGKFNADYDGAIAALPLYSEGFADYQQLATFQAEETVEESIPIELLPDVEQAKDSDAMVLETQLNRTTTSLKEQVQQVVKLPQRVSVYYGFLLAAERGYLLAFRDTQRLDEMLADLLAFQDDLTGPRGESLGKVHGGFNGLYRGSLREAVLAAIAEVRPDRPFYVTGHSLGGAIANLAALEIALERPELRPHLHLYTYARPRVGNASFATQHSERVPNHYRVVNLADLVPMMPISKLGGDFVHAGEQWSFLAQHGDILPNHIVETYRLAIAQAAETQDAVFTNLHLSVPPFYDRNGR